MSQSSTVSVLLFGIARDLTGKSTLQTTLPATGRVGDLLDALRLQHPALGGIKSLLIAVNGDYADPDTQLHPNDEIALIPPVSGG
jgi:molybdopterin converting factor subunit 1